MQVKEKHKHRPQNLIRFHLQGCSSILKPPPILPTSKDTHCNNKRFGNLPPSFRSLAFFLTTITVGSLAHVSVDNWYENFREFRSMREKGNYSKDIAFFPKTFHRDEPFHLNFPWNYQKFHSNGKHSWTWCAYHLS